MAVIYLIFNEGYAATAGDDWMRPDLAAEATRLARMLADLAPDEPEVLGLQALLELQGSRTAARLSPDGTPVLLEAQDRSLWDQLMIRRGLAALRAASRLAARGAPVGRYFLQASIAAEHATASRAEDTDWAPHRRAVRRPRAGRARAGRRGQPGRRPRPGARCRRPVSPCSTPSDPRRSATRRCVPSVRGDLLERAGRHAEAAAAFAEAAALHPQRGRAPRAAAAGGGEPDARRVTHRVSQSGHRSRPVAPAASAATHSSSAGHAVAHAGDTMS